MLKEQEKIDLRIFRFLSIVFLAILFFVSTSALSYFTHEYGEKDFVKWGSPDESANYVFTKLYAEERKLTVFEELNIYAHDIIHPRSVRSDSGYMKPMSFLGIILLYGKAAEYLGYKFIPYFTPFLASLGLIFYYLLVRKIFGRNIALISTFLLTFFPAYIYYTSRSMFHNVPLVVFIVIGLYFSIKMTAPTVDEKGVDSSVFHLKAFLFSALAGLFFALALITRSSELVWVLPMLFFLWLINFNKIGLFRLFIFIIFFIAGLLPALHNNLLLYGSPFFGGYTEMNESITMVADASEDFMDNINMGKIKGGGEIFKEIKTAVFYFGIHPIFSLKMVYRYVIEMFYFLFWPAVIGALFFLSKIDKWKRPEWSYAFPLFLVASILFLYYGSWEFHDNPDPNSFTIGNSYTRYWLPVYLGILPLMGLTIAKIAEIIFKYVFPEKEKKERVEENKPEFAAYAHGARKEVLKPVHRPAVVYKPGMKTMEDKKHEGGIIQEVEVVKKQEVLSEIEVGEKEEIKKAEKEERLKEEKKSIWEKFLVFKVRKQIFIFAIETPIVIAFIFLSLNFVLYGSEEGLIYSKTKTAQAKVEWVRILEITEPEAVIITQYHDKIFFPERKVIVGGFEDVEMVKAYKELTNHAPVYYYNFTLPKENYSWLQEKRLKENGLQIEKIEQVNDDFTLYKIFEIQQQEGGEDAE